MFLDFQSVLDLFTFSFFGFFANLIYIFFGVWVCAYLWNFFRKILG